MLATMGEGVAFYARSQNLRWLREKRRERSNTTNATADPLLSRFCGRVWPRLSSQIDAVEERDRRHFSGAAPWDGDWGEFGRASDRRLTLDRGLQQRLQPEPELSIWLLGVTRGLLRSTQSLP